MQVSRAWLPKWVQVALVWVVVANVLDFWLTLYGLDQAVIAEANPFMAPIIAYSPLTTGVIKALLVMGGVGALAWVYPRRPRFTGAAVALLSGVMLWVMGLHVTWLWLYLGSKGSSISGS